MSAKPPRFSGYLADIARVAGDEAAAKIGRQFGGTRVYIPSKPRADHWLTQLVGQDAADAIGEELTAGIAGIRIDLPVGEFGHQRSIQAQCDAMIEAGATTRDIALTTRYTERNGFYRKAKKARATQGELFGPSSFSED